MEKYSDLSTTPLNSTQEGILLFLKMRGPQSASVLAGEFGITNEGARQHLVKLEEKGLIKSGRYSRGVGRPVVLFSLTEKGYMRFPDTHAELTVQLLAYIRTLFGPESLDRLLEARERDTMAKYAEAMKGLENVEEKLSCLARIRTEEGYMAEWEKEEGGYLFVENHCPVCAAARECQGFCRAELHNFRQALGEGVHVERTEHIVKGARRCAYRVTGGNR